MILTILTSGCDYFTEHESENRHPAAHMPEQQDIYRVVGELRAILPSVPARNVAPPAPRPYPEASAARPVLEGQGRLIYAEGRSPGGSARPPPSIRVTLYLNDQPVPQGYLHLRPDGGPAQRWPILSAVLDGRLDADFTYTFRLADPQNRLRFLTVLGLGYGIDNLRFRAFEGYLIFPGAGGTVSRQEPMYAIDFGYRWPEPPRHVRMAQRLATLTASLEEGGRSLSAAREARADAENAQKVLQAASVPADQETARQNDLRELARQAGLRQIDVARLKAELAADLERIYRLRSERVDEWARYRLSNAYRWQRHLARGREIEPVDFTARVDFTAQQEVWSRVFGAVNGSERETLNRAREAMEAALLREFASISREP